MGHHQPKRAVRVLQQCEPDNGVAVKFEVVLHRLRHLRLGRGGFLRLGFAAVLGGGPRGFLGVLGGQVAFVEFDLSAMGAFDIDLAAFGLGDLLMLPSGEIRAHIEHDDVAPARFAVAFRFGFDGGGLGLPEGFGIGEVAFLAEQVVDDLAGVLRNRKQRRRRWDRRTAAEPAFEIGAGRDISVVALIQRQPFLLLALGRHGEVLHGFVVDVLGAVGLLDLRQEIGECQALPDRLRGDAESGGDAVDGAPAFDELGEGFVFAEGVGIAPRKVFDQRNLDGLGVVAVRHDGAKRRVEFLAFAGDDFAAQITPAARDHAEIIVFRAHDQGQQDALFADARQDVGHVRVLPAVAHVEFRDMQLFDGYMFEFHNTHSLKGARSSPRAHGRNRPRQAGGGSGWRKARRKSLALLA